MGDNFLFLFFIQFSIFLVYIISNFIQYFFNFKTKTYIKNIHNQIIIIIYTSMK